MITGCTHPLEGLFAGSVAIDIADDYGVGLRYICDAGEAPSRMAALIAHCEADPGYLWRINMAPTPRVPRRSSAGPWYAEGMSEEAWKRRRKLVPA